MQFPLLRNWGKLLLLLQVLIFGELSFATLTIAQGSSESSKKTIYFGYERNSYPISFEEQSSLDSDTFCHNLFEHLQQNYDKFTFESYPINSEKRFSLVQDNNINLDISCGSYSITPKRQKNLYTINAGFSVPFLTTGFNYIVKKDDEDVKQALINKQEIDINKKIAVIEGTTPYDYLMDTHTIYRKNIKPFKTKLEIIDALREDDTIVAYISDEILLKGILVKSELQNKYELLNPNPINNRDEMGIIIYNYTPEINDMVNGWLLSQGTTVIKNIDNRLDYRLKEPTYAFRYLFWSVPIIIVVIAVIIFIMLLKSDFIMHKFNNVLKSRKTTNPNLFPNTKDSPKNAHSIPLTQIFNIGENTMTNNDQSQKLNIGGNVSNSSVDQKSNATINIASNNLTQPDISKALDDLERLLKQETSLTPENKTEALEEIENLKEASQNPQDPQLKKQAKSSWKFLKGVPDGLKTTNETIKQFKELLPIIQSFFGF